MAQGPRTQERDWYSISVGSLRTGLGMIVLVMALIGGGFIYQQWEQRTRRDRAERAIDEAGELALEVAEHADYDQLRLDHHVAWDDLEDARGEFEAERYGPALSRARAAIDELEGIFDLGQGDTGDKSHFLSIDGGVEYRRGERGAWVKARSNDSLNAGDWIKTSDSGTAEIRLPDGSTYVLRNNTLVHLGLSGDSTTVGEPVAQLEFGWVEFNTAQGGSKIKTPGSETVLEGDTEATISYDPNREEGHVTTFAGGTKVTSVSGQTQEMGPLQKVDQQGDQLSAPKPVLPNPRLTGPANNQEIDFDTQKELRLAWEGVRGAARYALNVSRSQIFATNVIEDERRRKTWARVGIRGEGIFYWRVAAFDRQGTHGAWSETRSFRIASLRGAGETDDKTPPDLSIDDIQVRSNVVMVNGRTEAGATVTINGEPVSVELNGSFNKTIEMTQAGDAFITVVATDTWNNSTEVKKRVFIDVY